MMGVSDKLRAHGMRHLGREAESLGRKGFGGTLAYTYSPNFGSAGTNYLSTGSTYDPRGRMAASTSAAGTITHSFFDELSQVTAVWKGSDDVPDSDLNGDGLIDLRDFRWQVAQDGTAPAGTSMYKIASSTYDEEGNLVTSTQWADGSTSYTSTFVYDFRSRVVFGGHHTHFPAFRFVSPRPDEANPSTGEVLDRPEKVTHIVHSGCRLQGNDTGTCAPAKPVRCSEWNRKR